MVSLGMNKPVVRSSRRVSTGKLGLSSNPFPRNVFECMHCGRSMNNYEGGYSRGWNNELLCHPNAKNRPDCYKLVTTYEHPMPCTSKTCYEDHESLETYITGFELETK